MSSDFEWTAFLQVGIFGAYTYETTILLARTPEDLMRELKNVIRRGRTAGLTPAHYAISDVPAGIFDADVFAHFSLSLSLCRSLSRFDGLESMCR